MKQTFENIAAIRLEAAAKAMRGAVFALFDVQSDEAKKHAKELDSAAQMIDVWINELRKQHSRLICDIVDGYACDKTGMIVEQRCKDANGGECLCWSARGE